ncbi:MAG TPA: PAS domain-containing protein [Gaiellaceae bacterium]|nr:PAS domain-containing protein [Gaiellaceae bacterium]
MNHDVNHDEFNGLDFATAVNDLAAPAYVIDREGRFRWVNQAYVEIFGDRRGHPFVDYVAPEHRQKARTNFARKVVGKTTTIFDLNVLDSEGERVTLRITSAPLRQEGKIIGIFGIGIPLPQASVPARSVLDELTPRQQEVLRLLAEGLETPEIAQRLGVAEETARNHIRALLRATGAHSRLEAVLMGMRLGVVGTDMTTPDPPDLDSGSGG